LLKEFAGIDSARHRTGSADLCRRWLPAGADGIHGLLSARTLEKPEGENRRDRDDSAPCRARGADDGGGRRTGAYVQAGSLLRSANLRADRRGRLNAELVRVLRMQDVDETSPHGNGSRRDTPGAAVHLRTNPNDREHFRKLG